MLHSGISSENIAEIGDKPTRKDKLRIRRYFNIGILGMILLILAYILLLGVFSADEYWRLFPSEIPIEIWRQINFSLQSGYLTVILLQITGALLGSMAFFGYWYEFTSRVFLIPPIVTIILAGILYCDIALEFFLAVLTSGIYSARYSIFQINLVLGVILLLWGSSFRLLRSHFKDDKIFKVTCVLLFFSGIFAIAFLYLFMFGGILFILFPIGVDFQLILHSTLSLLMILTLIPSATLFNRSKELLVSDMHLKKQSEFMDIKKIPQTLRKIRSVGLTFAFSGFMLCVPRFISGAYFPFYYSITLIGFFIVALGLTLIGIGFFGMAFLSRSILSFIAGIIAMCCGWLILANEITSLGAVSFLGRSNIPMYAYPGPHYIPYFMFFLIGFALMSFTFIISGVTLYNLKKAPYEYYHPAVGAAVPYLVGGSIVLFSFPLFAIMLGQSIQLLFEGVLYLSNYPPIINTLSIVWGVFIVLISCGIFLEILAIARSKSEFKNSNSSL